MNRSLIAVSAIALATTAVTHAGLVDPNLEAVMREAPPDQVISTLVYLSAQTDTGAITDQLDAQRATLRERHEVVVSALRDLAAGTQGDLLDYLAARADAGAVKGFRPFWISNVIHVEATPAELRRIADRPDVDWVYYDYEMELIEPVASELDGGPLAAGGPEPGVEAVRAPEVWAMGITGQGVLVSTLDTGVDGNHPALATRWRGVADSRYAGHPEWAWFDPVTNTTFPQAFGSHGTHTMGSVCGGAPGDPVGVAPGAQWIHAATIDRVSIARTVSDSLLAFEWLLDPDGDPATNWDVPAVCSNSWGLVTSHGYPPCDQTFWAHLDACEAAGIVILFSAGNEGTSGLRRPADRATDDYRTAAVAAVDANDPNWPIAGFSSRGPTNCTPGGESAIKPDIAAPGVNVRSAVPGGYGNLSGTSMASPHVNGVVALMREANPDLAVEQVKEIIYDTAVDLGSSGEDNAYGWGMIDAFEAVQAAIAQSTLRFTFPGEFPVFVDPTGGTRIRVIVSGEQNQPEPGTGMFYYATGTTFTQVPMEESDPNVYDAVFPAFGCGDHVRYYFSAETTEGDVIFNPFTAPDSTYAADAYSGLNVFFTDDFETDRGWTVEDSPGLTSGSWERGVPTGGGRGDPSQDSDGSGQCYVTGLVDNGDNDIDGGSTTLTSPPMDASDADAVLSYDRWYSNTFGADPENDIFVIEVSDDDGANWEPLETVGPSGPDVNGGWVHKAFLVADIPNVSNSASLRVRFNASDLNDGSVVEAGVDRVEITALFCEGDRTPGDADGDGDVDFQDVLLILSKWGPVDDCPPFIGEDADQDCDVDFDDLLIALSNWSS